MISMLYLVIGIGALVIFAFIIGLLIEMCIDFTSSPNKMNVGRAVPQKGRHKDHTRVRRAARKSKA